MNGVYLFQVFHMLIHQTFIEFITRRLLIKNSNKWYLISKESQQKILEWIERFVSGNPNHEFIYRLHPTEMKSTDYSYLNKLNEKYSIFHFIFKYSVQDWILSSDYINTWISTSIVECYFLNKVFNVLRPIKVDEYLIFHFT